MSIREIEGKWEAVGNEPVAIVASRFNALVVERLVEGAKGVLLRQGIGGDQITLVYVPGAFEIPFACHCLAKTQKYGGILALGAVIRGDTAHFEYVSQACTQGVLQVQLQTGIPITFGVLTTEDQPQALARAGGTAGNKGAEAALALLEMMSIKSQLYG